MQFTNPIWLWGLTGLMIPIGIHLLSRKESKVIRIGSIRYLEESTTKQSVSLRLNELILLALRCLLITLIVLLLSGLSFNNDQTKNERWLVIESGLENDATLVPLVDSLQKNGFQTRRLEEGFPPISSSKTLTPVNYWRLMEDLNAKTLQQCVVLSYNYAAGFKGQRISMPGNLTWISKNPAPSEFPLQAIRLGTDSAIIRMGNTAADETSFESRIVSVSPAQTHFHSESGTDSVVIELPDTLIITIVNDEAFEYDKQMLLAALQAIDESSTTLFDIKTAVRDQWDPAEKTDWMILLSDQSFTDASRTNTILYQADVQRNKPLLEQQNSRNQQHHQWILTKRLTEDVILKEKLPLHLASLLLSKKESERLVDALDRRVYPEKLLWSHEEQSKSEKVTSATATSIAPWLAILIIVSLFAERLVAINRKQ